MNLLLSHSEQKKKVPYETSAKASVSSILLKTVKKKKKKLGSESLFEVETAYLSNERIKYPKKYEFDPNAVQSQRVIEAPLFLPTFLSTELGEKSKTMGLLQSLDDNTSNKIKRITRRSILSNDESVATSSSFSSRSLDYVGSIVASSSQSVGGNKNYRSYSINALSEDGHGERRTRTIQELVREIEFRSKNNMKPPAFLPKLSELSPSDFSWDHKPPVSKASNITVDSSSPSSTRTTSTSSSSASEILSLQSSATTSSKPSLHSLAQAHSKSLNSLPSLPSVNIQPCLHPVEIILAKADERSRKIQHVLELKSKNNAEHIERIDGLIKNRVTKAEKHAEKAQNIERQREWLRIIYTLNNASRMRTVMQSSISRIVNQFHLHNSAIRIQRQLKAWYRRRIFWKYKLGVTKRMGFGLFMLRFNLRIVRKRRAAHRLYCFLENMRNKARITFLIHRFLKSVRRIQGLFRVFLACKRARMDALEIIWDKFEYKYIRRVLKERQESIILANSRSFEMTNLDYKTRYEMEKQMQRWDKINVKMEKSIEDNRRVGNLKMEPYSQGITKHMLPRPVKIHAITETLRSMRKSYVLKIKELYDKRYSIKNEFGVQDAFTLLHGNIDTVQKKFIDKLDDNKKPVPIGIIPFSMLSYLDHDLMLKRINELHAQHETFAFKRPEELIQKK